ncbi:MAG: YgiQ family radical SAM protein [Deltaproteobacteria bacterium]|nr:YgiQ family radical SAM protein [Deltaproteobacteria bacterium]
MKHSKTRPLRFLPTTKNEMRERGWSELDIILISGDTYIDSPYIGVAVIGRVLETAGFKVGIIAQPDTKSGGDIQRLGAPRLFWGVTGGSVDSMVANYTAIKKRRKSDDFTPGCINNRRPDRAVIVYSNLIRQYFKNTAPIVLGGIEASLRRLSHYDFWTNKIRKSLLFDAKADALVYGMAEKTIVELARAIDSQDDFRRIAGLCYAGRGIPPGFLELPTYSAVVRDKQRFAAMFRVFYQNNDPLTAQGLAQLQDDRYLIQNPPPPYLRQEELDAVNELPFTRAVHPYYREHGVVRALTTIQFSITTHRGCYGECNFCAIAVHQGRTVRMRSQASILREAVQLTRHPDFKGNIMDVGGPTANMYGFECPKKLAKGPCRDKRCLIPVPCPQLKIRHDRQITLLGKLRNLPGVKHVFVASGIRYDMVMADKMGREYLNMLVQHHVSGQMKIAPEHCLDHVLEKMAKPPVRSLLKFRELFNSLNRAAGKKQFLTYYFIAAHPGCTRRDMEKLQKFCHQKLHTSPEQVQIFTPTPSTYSTMMYWTGIDPFSSKSIYCEREKRGKEEQKKLLTDKRLKPQR